MQSSQQKGSEWKEWVFLNTPSSIVAEIFIEKIEALLLYQEKRIREEMLLKIKNMLLWSKGTVEGTRNDIIAKLSTINNVL